MNAERGAEESFLPDGQRRTYSRETSGSQNHMKPFSCIMTWPLVEVLGAVRFANQYP
jgi:hypothetical protein